MTDLFKHAYFLISPEEQPKKEWYQEVEEQVCSIFPSLSWQHRIIGCITCMTLGFIISMGSTFRIIKLLEGNPVPFATTYSLGNLIGICSTCFLYGPWAQIKKMFAPTRLFATGIYLFFLGLTLLLAFYPKEIPFRVVFLVFSILCQFLALMWYSLSFIPFAREMMKTFCSQVCCNQCCGSTTQDEAFWA